MNGDYAQQLRYGMVGGGAGSFIGAVHRKALDLTGRAELVCGCFGSNASNSLKMGRSLGVAVDRVYPDYLRMAEAEAARPDKIDFVIIATPNYTHYEIAKAFLNRSFNVVCEKPLCFSCEEAQELQTLAAAKGLSVCVTYTYMGYTMVKEARRMIRAGSLGAINMIMAEYAQEWFAVLAAASDGKINRWRNIPAYGGSSNCVGDIGSHIEYLVSYITGLEIDSLCANLRAIGKGAVLDTNGEILVKYTSGASGIYWCSQVAVGSSNGLKVRVFGSKGSLEWEQENPDILKVNGIGEPGQTLRRGQKYLPEATLQYSELPAGHPEGFYEAFANIYAAYTEALLRQKDGTPLAEAELDYPGVSDGRKGVRFIEKCVASSQSGLWVKI
jgi:predicted dehydrogenase